VAAGAGRGEGFRNITANDAEGNSVVIELKAIKARSRAIAQLLAYMGELKMDSNSLGLRGILVAPEFDATGVAAASMIPNVVLKRYRFHLSFEDAR